MPYLSSYGLWVVDIALYLVLILIVTRLLQYIFVMSPYLIDGVGLSICTGFHIRDGLVPHTTKPVNI